MLNSGRTWATNGRPRSANGNPSVQEKGTFERGERKIRLGRKEGLIRAERKDWSMNRIGSKRQTTPGIPSTNSELQGPWWTVACESTDGTSVRRCRQEEESTQCRGMSVRDGNENHIEVHAQRNVVAHLPFVSDATPS